MKPNVSSSSTFPWRGEERRGGLATHGDVEMEGDFVRNHGGMVVRFRFGEVREERKWKMKKMDMKW